MQRHRMIVDAMGGDQAPRVVVEGSLLALREVRQRFDIVLVGRKEAVEEQIRSISGGPPPPGITIVDAPQVIEMNDAPTAALRAKKGSSIAVGLEMLKQGKGSAFISAGNTGAVLAASTLILGKLPGVTRPTIGAFLPTETGVCLLVDAGANVDSKPRHLFEFAVMGSIYFAEMVGVEKPRVGLLSIGEENIKGDERTQQAHKLLSESNLNFIGNIEGRDILLGKSDVIVCDGFVGNVVLKFAESVLTVVKDRIKQVAFRNLFHKASLALAYGALRMAFRSFDYQEYGGVPLLGVKGVSVIGHGLSSPKAIKNMILKAEEAAEKKIPERIQSALAELLTSK
ncbi:MAG: phosphate acyltransferase PlsX [Bacteroidota bacterium]